MPPNGEGSELGAADPLRFLDEVALGFGGGLGILEVARDEALVGLEVSRLSISSRLKKAVFFSKSGYYIRMINSDIHGIIN